jgi:regulator of RNase E activity RraA
MAGSETGEVAGSVSGRRRMDRDRALQAASGIMHRRWRRTGAHRSGDEPVAIGSALVCPDDTLVVDPAGVVALERDSADVLS